MNKFLILFLAVASFGLISETGGFAKNDDINIFYVDYCPTDNEPI